MGKRGRPPHPDILTPREWQVLDLLRQGLTNEQIAHRLDISYATAKYHVAEIISKLGVQTREEAAAWRPEAVAVRWWWRAGVPVAGASAAALALVAAGLGLLVLTGDAGSDDKSSISPQSPSTSPSESPATLGRLITPMGTTTLREGGPYILEVETGGLYRGGGGIWSPDSTATMVTSCCVGQGGIDIVDVRTGEGVRILEGDVTSATWSPDAKQIVFTSLSGGPAGLSIINRDGTGLRNISSGSGAANLAWSPRGDRIAYLIPAESRSYVIDLSTGNTSVVLASDHFAWSPDGESLAFVTEAGLQVYDVDSGSIRQLAEGPSDPPILWSPDGSMIGFRYGEPAPLPFGGGIRALHVIGVAAGQAPMRVALVFSASWSADSTRIVHLGGGCVDNDWDLYVTNVDTGSTTRLTNSRDTIKEGSVWSPTGSLVAFSTFTDLFVIDTNSGSITTAATLEGWPETGHLHVSTLPSASWSPDARYVSFATAGGHGICT